MRQPKSAQIITRVTEDDRAWVDQEAGKRGLGASGFIRMTLRQARAALEEQPRQRGDVQPPQHEAA